MPKTKLGKWSIGLALALIALIASGSTLDSTFYRGVEGGDSIFEDIALRPLLAIPMLIGWLSGMAALITGLVAITRRHERAFLVYVSTAMGALLLLFMIGDLFSAE